jgi:hypothetical protein
MKDIDTLEIIYKAIDAINEELSLSIVKDPETRLFGSKGTLDSIGLVNFITIIEELVEKETGKYITVANEAAMQEASSPFKSVAALEKHVNALVKASNA